MTIFNRKLLRINQARIINNFADYNFIYHEIISRIKENISLKYFLTLETFQVFGISPIQPTSESLYERYLFIILKFGFEVIQIPYLILTNRLLYLMNYEEVCIDRNIW